ncbi:MAG: DUF4926 domain-containing protein [Aphanocapsa lilacina HA4352-LM1]|nr:DUF4926 domain-containing protein [Aphanocapsa lilacina HA4352-LM1]
MKASVNDRVEILENLNADFSDKSFVQGTCGTIVEVYDNPEGYAVDLAIPDPNLVAVAVTKMPSYSLHNSNWRRFKNEVQRLRAFR